MPDESHPTLQVLRIRNLRLFVAMRFFYATGQMLFRATISWHVFALTGSVFDLGMLGVIEFLPVIPLSLIAGAVADTHDRRKVSLVATLGVLVLIGGLAAVTLLERVTLPILYGAAMLISICLSFERPARLAMLPALVPRSLFPTAVTLNSAVQNMAWTGGPMLAGGLIHLGGVGAAYAANIGLLLTAGLLLVVLRAPPIEGEGSRVSWAAIREGIEFVWRRRVILSSMTLDLFAVIFASVTALLPVFAVEILDVGALGYGLLSSSLEIGTLLMAGVLLVRPPLQRPGRALLITVVFFGLATILFGLSRSPTLSMLALVIAGMADQVSMIARSTIIQLSTPDSLRGRVNSVNMIFISASNQLGRAESGFLAALTSATFSVIAGGVICLGVVGAVAARVPEMRTYQPSEAPDPE